MFSSFPPFPSPNPAAMNHSPLENAPVVPSPPSSDTSSMASSPSLTPSSTPTSPRLGNSASKPAGRQRSRSAARNSVPPRTRIIRNRDGNNSPHASPHSPPITPPLETKKVEYKTEEVVHIPDVTESGVLRKKSVRTHNYEDAMRITCGAWGETVQKKKTVSWGDKEISA